MAFHFDKDSLLGLAAEKAASYRHQEPFPHIVIDQFMPAEVLKGVLSEVSELGQSRDEKNVFHTQRKSQFNPVNSPELGQHLRNALNELNSYAFIQFLEKLTGIAGLIPDPYFAGGGLHQIRRGGFLKIHADFNWHDQLKLDRRVNVLLYLNEDWQDQWGGHLELWDTQMKSCKQKIAPIFNRLVVFNTTDDSFHGHPDPLSCPEGRIRNSIALYYYSNGRPSTDRKKGKHAHTLYQERPNERFHTDRVGRKLREFVPSFAYDLRDRFLKSR